MTTALADGAERASNLIFEAESPYGLGEEVGNICAEVLTVEIWSAQLALNVSPLSGKVEDTVGARVAPFISEGGWFWKFLWSTNIST